MKKVQRLDRRLEAAAWGLLLVWWGLRWWLLTALPNGAGLLGTGLILLGLNTARSLKGIPPRRTTTRLGALAIIMGGALTVASQIFHLHIDIPLFAGLLVALGMFFLFTALDVGQNPRQA